MPGSRWYRGHGLGNDDRVFEASRASGPSATSEWPLTDDAIRQLCHRNEREGGREEGDGIVLFLDQSPPITCSDFECSTRTAPSSNGAEAPRRCGPGAGPTACGGIVMARCGAAGQARRVRRGGSDPAGPSGPLAPQGGTRDRMTVDAARRPETRRVGAAPWRSRRTSVGPCRSVSGSRYSE
jgi:hypothetical protein